MPSLKNRLAARLRWWPSRVQDLRRGDNDLLLACQPAAGLAERTAECVSGSQ